MTCKLRTAEVSRWFGGLAAVKDVTVAVDPGSITGLIGPNGAGKSTLFNVMTGILPASQGRVFVDDVDVTSKRPADIASLGIGRTFQTPRGFPTLSVRENVEVMLKDEREKLFKAVFAGNLFSKPKGNGRVVEALETVGLSDRKDDAFLNLSSGEQRLLEIARQLVREPRVLLLDEPTAGVHPSLQATLRDLFLDLHEQGVTLVIVEHNLAFLMELAERVYVMANGKVIKSGDPGTVSNDPEVMEAYLGRKEPDAAAGS
jgi:branched-chain amino acid transport system ATP-binding protein